MPDVRDSRVFEEIHHAPLALAPDAIHAAGTEQEAVGVLSDADVERNRSLDRLDDVPESDLVCRTGEDVAPMRPTPRADQPLVDQLPDDLLEKLARDPLLAAISVTE